MDRAWSGGSQAGGDQARGGSLSSRERPGFCPRFFLEYEPPPSCAPDTGGALRVDAVLGTDVVLGAEDSRHAVKALRIRAGERCEVVTPSGRAYAAAVSRATEPVHVRLVASLEGAAAGAIYRTQVGVVQALARPSVIDYAIEKGTEVGASFFLLVPATGSASLKEEARADRLARWGRIAREAAKQSKQTAVPWVDFAESVGDGLARMAGIGALTVILEPGAGSDLPRVLRVTVPGHESALGGSAADRPSCIALWVGPEGGWTEADLRVFQAAGAVMARLGRSVLRTETAGPVAVAVARLELGDW
jgi:16S rRNA (uracil1498-N3)-methyltransferase